MPATNSFFVKFAPSIIAVLGCHDRLIFKGYLPFSNEAHLNRFVDHSLRIKRKDFLAFAEEKAELLVSNAKALATREGAPTSTSRDATARKTWCSSKSANA